MGRREKNRYLITCILFCVVVVTTACSMVGGKAEKPTSSDANSITLSAYENSPIKHIVAGEHITINADGAQLTIPETALEADISATLQTSDPDSELESIFSEVFQIKTNLYQITADGENDGIGTAAIEVSDSNGQSFLLEIIDGEYFSLTSLEANNGKITFQVPIVTTPKDEGDDSLRFDGSYHFAIIQTSAKLNLEPLANKHMVKLMAQPTDTLNCGSLSKYITEVDFCRQNPGGTIKVLYDRMSTPNMTNGKADQIISVAEKIINAYESKGFVAAKLEKSQDRIHLVIEKGAGDPYYSSSNGTIYIPEDSTTDIDAKLSWEMAHEIAHWVQDHSYNFAGAYWGNLLGTSTYRKWWLEVSAENMVFLFDPAYIDQNLTYYGMTTPATKNTPFQYSPNLWNSQLYNHAQLVKVFMCENPAVCPISESGFVNAINQGTFPYKEESAINQVSENLNEYARYLLGKSPQSANSHIPIMPAVKNGVGYGEFIEPIFKGGMSELKKTGYAPQMVSTGEIGSQIVNINAAIQPGGVYPLNVQSGINPELNKLPLQVTVFAGAPFYYRIGEGDIQYSDGSKEMILGLVHPVWGVKKIRLVAIANESEANFKAEIRSIDMSGVWSMNRVKDTTVSNISCDEEKKVWVAEYAAGRMFPFILGMGDFSLANSFNELTWDPNSIRWESYISNQDQTVSTLDVMSSQGLALINPEETLLNMEYIEQESPPYKFDKTEGDAISWDQVVGNYILTAAYKNLEYLSPQNPGEPSWKLSDGMTNIDINVTIVVMQFGPDGELQYPKTSVTCSGTLSYDAEIFITPLP